MKAIVRMLCAAVMAVVAAGAATPAAAAVPVPGALVSVDWLKANLGNPDLVVIDIRGASPADAFAVGHVPGAVWSAYSGAWRGVGDIPGAVPPTEALVAHVASLGVDANKTVVIVSAGTFATDFGGAARVYWTFKYLGHDAVAILDGGWTAWLFAPDTPKDTATTTPKPATFVAHLRPELLATTPAVSAKVGTATVILDARNMDEYLGWTKTDPITRFGHIPGALSLDNASLFDSAAHKLKRPDQLKAVAEAVVGSREADIVTYCVAGHWSATEWFVLHEMLGYQHVALYADSMVGWSADAGRPVDVDPAARR
jgi:thiosulfate/3-mercaptopyruvate sulfurtransferase